MIKTSAGAFIALGSLGLLGGSGGCHNNTPKYEVNDCLAYVEGIGRISDTVIKITNLDSKQYEYQFVLHNGEKTSTGAYYSQDIWFINKEDQYIQVECP